MNIIKNIVNENERYIEIYKITNKINNKIYIGQTVSHILNHRKYRKYGCIGRFNSHISESKSLKKNQCTYLNNAIRKYGPEHFTVDLLTTCDITKGDEIETEYISKYNSLYPNGYNLKNGGKVFKHTNESKKKVSNGIYTYFKDKKMKRFENIDIPDDLNDNIDKYIRPLNRFKEQYGWYVYICGKKADFGGSHISLNDSKLMAQNFILDLLKLKQYCKTS